ncbi:MAG: diguanylate cyclase [Peptostreptococcaceae bacterium]|nr:diguanylate cyclase [Peptostreptococcaceae bacterium]
MLFKNLFIEYYKTTEDTVVLKNENNLICFFGAILMPIGSLSSVLTFHYFMYVDFAEAWSKSLVMIIPGIICLLMPLIHISEYIKLYLISLVFLIFIVFFPLNFYIYIGPAVWTIDFSIILSSLLYSNNRMLIIVIIATFLNIFYFDYNNVVFTNWSIFYQAEIISLLSLSMVIITIHIINKKRTQIISKQYNAINKSEEKLKLTLESVGDGVITMDGHGNIELMNPIAQKLTGWYNDEFIGVSIDKVFDIINEYTREKTENPVKLVFNTGKIVELANHTLLISRDGTERFIEDTAAPIIDTSGEIIGCVLVFRDSSEKKEKQRQVEYLSYHDQLTGLYNRRYYEEELKRLDTKRNLPITVVYADVNGLKIVNDALGHDQGDQLIQKVSESFKAVCRADDIIARVGGDEFMILLPKTDKVTADNLIERIIATTNQIEVSGIKTSVSFGWDTKNNESCLVMNIIKNAEELMYQNKILNSSSNRNVIVTSILNTLLVKSPREEAHSLRVSILCEEIGKAYHLKTDELKALSILGKLHDIGKIFIDESILNSSNELSHSEFALIKKHPEIGYRLLGSTSEFNVLANDVLAHHERWDGAGYPNGLKGDAISWNARILSIADSYDAMVSERSYKASSSQEEAIEEIRRNAGTQFDPEIAMVFIEKVIGKF